MENKTIEQLQADIKYYRAVIKEYREEESKYKKGKKSLEKRLSKHKAIVREVRKVARKALKETEEWKQEGFLSSMENTRDQ